MDSLSVDRARPDSFTGEPRRPYSSAELLRLTSPTIQQVFELAREFHAPIGVQVRGDTVVMTTLGNDPSQAFEVVLDGGDAKSLGAALVCAGLKAQENMRFRPARADDAHVIGGHD